MRLCLLPLLLLAGCIPYTVGTTAAPAAAGGVTPSVALTFIPQAAVMDAAEDDGTTTPEAAGYTTFDVEGRIGLDAVSDVGIRAPGGSGVVVNYKRRLVGAPGAAGTAVMAGMGIINFGNHAHIEFTLVQSGRERETWTPYGGVRAMQTFPLNASAVWDSPTVGVFGGVRIGTSELGVSPEVGVFYDRSALGLRDSDLLIVPAVTLHGSDLVRLFLGR